MRREEAEVVAADLDEIGKQWRAEVSKKHPDHFMSEERRKELGIPDISGLLHESLIESLMTVELSEQGQRDVDAKLAARNSP